eukprot:TRINITY_DN733_c0_g1_i1.p1 TRINITY_DN733_c0_g1~~TRINITY_DN733_c0_g1_i1.p1  ORF type:complete len:248 (+),score=31.29 TRINITY_DN733_c0_g1_i1:65-808(+)
MASDFELASRAIGGYGELTSAMAHNFLGPDSVIHRDNAIGCRLSPPAPAEAIENPWFNSVVVPFGAVPPVDSPDLPLCIWADTEAIEGRVVSDELCMPCLGLDLDPVVWNIPGAMDGVETPSAVVLGDVNERAYNSGGFTPIVTALRDPRVHFHGLKDPDSGLFVCVGMTVLIGTDVSINYVATEQSHRRRGLATRLMRAMLAFGCSQGMQTATLLASPDGLPIYERLGFRRAATVRGFLRAGEQGN